MHHTFRKTLRLKAEVMLKEQRKQKSSPSITYTPSQIYTQTAVSANEKRTPRTQGKHGRLYKHLKPHVAGGKVFREGGLPPSLNGLFFFVS